MQFKCNGHYMLFFEINHICITLQLCNEKKAHYFENVIHHNYITIAITSGPIKRSLHIVRASRKILCCTLVLLGMGSTEENVTT